MSARALQDAVGDVASAVSWERNVTERQSLEAQIHQKEKLQALQRMAANVTHGMNNRLMVMQVAISSLTGALGTTDAFRESLETLAAVVDESRVCTRGLLDFCGGRARTTEPVRMPVLLQRVWPILCRLLGPQVQPYIDFRASDKLTVRGDAAELEQVIFNLCANANDAMRDGGILRVVLYHVRLTGLRLHMLGAVPEGEYVALDVSDTGVGMDAGTLARIFEPFFTTKSAETSSGFGLSTVYGVVNRYGGYVGVDSVPKLGTRFSIYLPCLPTDGDQRATSTTDRPAVGTGKLRVLVVDDDPMVRHAVVRIVQLGGHVVTACGSAAEALQTLGVQAFDVVLSDMQMPEMDGASLARQMQFQQIETPVVLMSGFSDVGNDALAEMPGVIGFLTKPFTADEVARALSAAAATVSGGA